MASTNKTTNLGLNQWVAADMVKREDFNADNLSIDNAFSKIPITLLSNYTLYSATTFISLDLSKVDLSKYRFLLIAADGKVAGSGFTDSEAVNLRINNDSDDLYYNLSGSVSVGSSEPTTAASNFSLLLPSANQDAGGAGALARIYPAGDSIIIASEGMGFRTVVEGGHRFCRYTGCSFEEIQQLVFSNFAYSTSKLQSGFRISIWGVRI